MRLSVLILRRCHLFLILYYHKCKIKDCNYQIFSLVFNISKSQRPVIAINVDRAQEFADWCFGDFRSDSGGGEGGEGVLWDKVGLSLGLHGPHVSTKCQDNLSAI